MLYEVITDAQAIREVHVSQAPPTFAGLAGDRLLKPEVRISAPVDRSSLHHSRTRA